MIDTFQLLFIAILGLLAYFILTLTRHSASHLALGTGAHRVTREPSKSAHYLLSSGSSGKAVSRSGTIRQLGPDKWQVRADLPKAVDGKRRRKAKNIYGTKLDAEAALIELQQELARSVGRDKPETVGELLDRWLAREVEPTVRRATYLDYKRKADLYVRPFLANTKLDDVDLTMVEGFRNELKKRPRRSKKPARSPKVRSKRSNLASISDTTVKAGLKTLSMALNYAVRHKFLTVNEVSNLKRTKWKKPKKKKKALNEEQLAAFLRSAQDNYWFPLFALLANTGMRPSEALGLQWSHIDWNKKWIKIEQKLTLYPDGSYEFEDPKTENSERLVPLSHKLRYLLERHRKRQEEIRAYDPELDLVFADLEGQPADSRNILRNHVKPIARRAGIDQNVTLYTLRYTFMTLSTGSTKAPKKTSKVLGHGTVSFSEDVYNDPDDEALRESTATMDSYLPELAPGGDPEGQGEDDGEENDR